ncbi:hypothetical protein GLOTRDRAFT_116216 [Gloeophyllum trabeum ATCC 11539]|uniref:F-box domain-containing protein n=1 Tax=Gloeophyllum trabeum (strain ATCC 11539 / FP-39264 / Madison 617) TaxID=670483 RepID=S7Q732_GLOTA|nr:uncharacterized protein GLOTRDRAFT_116216 [Gloeophyllum trabeum ATCC 11539]EPQ55248.1 hypothetical protein GLOTRDRAFT_116216 [Gloeophyllum trabeum ATCC 11539]
MDGVSLQSLPYDLLLNVAQHLELRDIHALQSCCRSLKDFVATRPVFRSLAHGLLRRCRALPLLGFQRISDLSTEQLVSAVIKADRLERAWITRTPRPAPCTPYDDPKVSVDDSHSRCWYKVVSAPPGEEVDWLSPITSSYTLCATKSGKVICWDVQRDCVLAEWDPSQRWELWKCRVEFEEKTVFFAMAKVVEGQAEERVMEFMLMKLQFPSIGDGESEANTPTFSEVTRFRTIGIVMNVFLLDPSSRLLAAFVWVPASNSIGLYSLLDWGEPRYVFIDTGIECSFSSNWSCIFYNESIVIHAEESESAFQHFYPVSLLQQHSQPLTRSNSFVPCLSGRVLPVYTISQPFIFPRRNDSHQENGDATTDLLNPYPFPPWYPESAHFVRQWWPTLPDIPRLSCTVVLLASHDPETHEDSYILTQHYFKVPLDDHSKESIDEAGCSSSGACPKSRRLQGEGFSDACEEDMMRMWYVSKPFEVVGVPEAMEEDEDGFPGGRRRPLVAVDFGHAAWIEYVPDEEGAAGEPRATKRLRFVSFPPISDGGTRLKTSQGKGKGRNDEVEGQVRTLEIPEGLNLDSVETINIDQSHGSIILSVSEGKIFIVFYE